MENNRFTRLTVEQPDLKVVWEVPYEDVSGGDMVNALKTLMIGMTFSLNSIPDIFADWLREYAADKYEIIEKNEIEEDGKDQ